MSEGNRVDLLQRAIDVVRALTKACVDGTRGSRRSGARAAAAAAAAAGARAAGGRRPRPRCRGRNWRIWRGAATRGAFGVRAARRRRRRGGRRGCLYCRDVVRGRETAGPHYHRVRRRRNI